MNYNGYAGTILRVNLSTGDISRSPTERYSDLYLGGRGIAARIYWDEVSPTCDAFDPENRLILVTGPICCVPGFAGSRWQACGKSPIANQFCYANLGGSWGAQLKFAGYDGLVIEGRADKPVYVWINQDQVEIRDAAHLWGMGAIASRERLKEELGKSARVVAVGPAGENRVVFATLLADADSSGSGGLGAVMGSKNLKAVAVKGQGRVEAASSEKVDRLRERVRELNAMKHGLIPDLVVTADKTKLKKDVCFGCISGCIRATYEGPGGKTGKFFCQPSYFYQTRAQRYYGEANDVPFEAAKLCDEYGVDTRAIETMIMWLSRCEKAGVLTEQQVGIPFAKIGSLEYVEALLRRVSLREGFGDVLAKGTFKAAEIIGKDSDKLITDYMTRYGENAVYGPRLYLTTGLFYAMEPRMPIQQLHEISAQGIMWALTQMGLDKMYLTSEVMRAIGKRFWGSEIAADFSTCEGKALAAARIQDRQYAKECMILCDLAWPIIHTPISNEGHVGDPTLESQLCAAVTGRDIDEQGLYTIGARVFNLQRAILAREGHRGREHDSLQEFEYSVPLKGDFGNPNCIVPGAKGEPFARKGMVVDRQEFERMKDEYYQIRGWDAATGLQRQAQMEALGLDDVARTLNKEGVLAAH